MPSDHDEELDALASALGEIVERVDDLALIVLREAAAAGETRRPEIERRLTRVRNALLRARALLVAEQSNGSEMP